MKTVLHKSDTRGKAHHGWLKSAHSFSFASYYNPERMGFGLLRVLNDDQVDPGTGFSTHPHRDMEIVSIPLKGALRHKDSEGNEAVIRHGEVQLMSAGTGVFHSEYNDSESEDVQFLQIWVMPEKMAIKPRYDQRKFAAEGRKNQWQTVVSPMDSSAEGIKINQQAYFSLIDLDAGKSQSYQIHIPGNGAYVFILEGEIDSAGEVLMSRDALGISETTQFDVKARKDAKVLIIEVPLTKT